jgi:hypothetical protein
MRSACDGNPAEGAFEWVIHEDAVDDFTSVNTMTTGMAIGDLDGDGWEDVVTCSASSYAQGNGIFMNDRGTALVELKGEPGGTWTSDGSGGSFGGDILLHDIEGDSGPSFTSMGLPFCGRALLLSHNHVHRRSRCVRVRREPRARRRRPNILLPECGRRARRWPGLDLGRALARTDGGRTVLVPRPSFSNGYTRHACGVSHE